MSRKIISKKVNNNFRNKLVSVVIVTKDRKKDLLECVNSYLKSSYKNLEIIIVDNGSKPPVFTWFSKKYPMVKIFTNEINLGAAEGRNKGFSQSLGDYILFTDDDAIADKDMVRLLLEAFKKNKNAGIIQPLVYDKHRKNLLQGAGHDIDLLTGRIRAWGVKEEDWGQYEGLREVPMCGCVWMVKREVFEKIGLYDSDYFIPYEDSDFSIRARKVGFKLYCYSLAKTYHQGIKASFVHPFLEWLGITSVERAYRIARNKIIFMRKHSPCPKNIFFFFILFPVYTLIHSIVIIFSRRLDVLLNYWLGVLSGIFYAVTFPIRDKLISVYKRIDLNLNPLKMTLMAWTDPLTWVIDSSSKSILDLACGQGKPMELIKSRIKIEKSIGVDLFEPYIKEAKQKKVHNEYIIKDIRKVSFPPKSFDIVLASHVIEHMPKKDAWRVLVNMEKWAKKQVIIATPIGKHYHGIEDGNVLQLHVSSFTPKEFQERGYKIKKYGFKWLLGDNGLVHSVKNDLIRKFLYTFNILLTPYYYIFQSNCDYTFVAYKKFKKA